MSKKRKKRYSKNHIGSNTKIKDGLSAGVVMYDEISGHENKYQITDKIIDMVANNKMTTKEVNEICFAVLYNTLMSKENIITLKEKMGIDILQLKGNELVEFVHTINKTLIQLNDDYSNINQLIGNNK